MQGKLLLILCAVRAEGYHSDPNFIYNSAFDSRYQRLAPGQLAREERLSEAPRYPFLPFSDAYVKKALAEPTNWTALGAVTPVKDQGPHGFCGTFGRVGSAEGQWALKGNALTSFSEQMLVSCIGWDADQFSYFSPRGFMTSQDYPYNETNYPDMDPPIPGNPCRFDPSKVVPGTGNAFFNASTGGATSEDQLAAFIHHNGPVSAGINAEVFGLRVKGCGVGPGQSPCFITKDMCLQVVDEIDHSTTFVGYGVDPQNGPYWLVKNSWGAKWANEGFIMVARGVGCAGICGGNVSHDSSICGNVFTHGSPDSYYPPSLLA